MYKYMNTSPPFAFPFKLPAGPQDLPSWMQPPAWLVAEIQQRVVLTLNHVLQQEAEAMARLARQKGKVISLEWAPIAIKLIATPAGLLDVAPTGAKPDLAMTVLDSNPFNLVQTMMSGKKPDLRIEGDIQLAAEVNWLVDHVRWDAEEDLSRIMGDAAAHSLVKVLRQALDTLKKFAPSSVNKPVDNPVSSPVTSPANATNPINPAEKTASPPSATTTSTASAPSATQA